MTRIAAFASFSLVALVTGASVALWTHFAAAAAVPPSLRYEPARVPAVALPGANLSDSLRLMREQQLEGRIAALEAAASEKAASVSPANSAPLAEDRVPPTAAEILALHEASITQHRSEPLDKRWSALASAAFTADYSHSPENTSFTVKEVDCRSTSCTVEFEWPSREAAVAEWKRTLTQATQATCGRRIVIPEAVPGQTGPIRATMLADCSTWVEQGSPVAER